MVLAGALIVMIVLFTVSFIQGNHIQSQTCAIQQTGLHAQKYLVGSLDDIHQLLIAKPSKAQKHNQAEQTKAQKVIIHHLNQNLAKYVQIQNSQPKHRVC